MDFNSTKNKNNASAILKKEKKVKCHFYEFPVSYKFVQILSTK